MIHQLSYHVHIRVFAFDDVVLEDSLSIQQVLFVSWVFLLRFGFVILFLFLLLGFSNVWSQDDDLLGFHDVDSIIRFLLKRTSLDKIDLRESVQLSPLLGGRKLIMKNNNRRRIFVVPSSQRHHKILNVLNHSTNNDMILS